MAEELYLDVVEDAAFFRVLQRIDRELAQQARQGGCQHCGGHLHAAYYGRAGRGGPPGLSDDLRVRFSLCCGAEGCRKRHLPGSCLFFGRRWYWGVIVLIVSVLQQRTLAGVCVERLHLEFGVSRATVGRWLRYFRHIFPQSLVWQRARGLVAAEVRNDQLPRSLLDHLETQGSGAEALARALRLLSRCQARSPGVDPFHARGGFIG